VDWKRDVTEAPNPKLMRVLRIVVGGLVAFIVLILILSALGGRVQEEERQAAQAAPAAGPPMVATADSSVRSASVEGADLNVDVLISSAWTSADYAPQTGIIVEALGKALQAGAGGAGTAEHLVLRVHAPGKDRLGNATEVNLYTVFFDISDLRAAQFDNLTYGETLNLATGLAVATAGRAVMIEYCASDRGARQSPRFCNPAS
jgi:hypothetical protein